MRSYGTSKRGALAFCLPHTNTTTLFELEHPSCPDSRNLRQTPSCPPFASIVYLHRRSLAQLPGTWPPVRSSIFISQALREVASVPGEGRIILSHSFRVARVPFRRATYTDTPNRCQALTAFVYRWACSALSYRRATRVPVLYPALVSGVDSAVRMMNRKSFSSLYLSSPFALIKATCSVDVGDPGSHFRWLPGRQVLGV